MNLDDWFSESLRITTFTRQPLSLDQSIDWWEQVVGEPPEMDQRQPKEQLRQQQGPFKNGKLILQIKLPDRIDWFYGEGPDSGPDMLPHLGPYPKAKEELRELILPWVTTAPPIKRFAFGAILIRKFDNAANALKFINDECLPELELSYDHVSEFAFHINRYRLTNLGGQTDFHINRISKWSLLRALFQKAQFSGKELIHDEPINFHGTRLELDINTNPENMEELPGEEALNLLISYGDEIITNGDIA